jgi:hypothetical protein
MATRQPQHNPFPGMNPYLERRWGDVHARLSSYAADQLQDCLPRDLRARMQERVFIESTDEVLLDPRQGFSPDVHVYERPRRSTAAASEEGGGVAVAVAATEPLIIHLPDVEVVESYVEIVDVASGGRVITTIEFVSRSNKRAGPGRKQYLKKRKETIRAGANVVEIDLLRGGKPVTLATPRIVGPRRWTPYHVSVFRVTAPDQIEYYCAPIRARLPVVKIPLRKSDADVKLDVQALVNQAYEKGRYDDIDYTAEALDPPLPQEEMAWATQLVAREAPPAKK